MELAGQHISAAELAGTLTGLIAVWLTVRENRWCFPIGIASCIIYAIVFFSPGIRYYSDALLQVFYVVLLIFGWASWKPSGTQTLRVTLLRGKEIRSVALFVFVMTLASGWTFNTYTDAALPYIDALTTSVSLAAQWMVARKKLENWYLWIAVNVVYVVMYIYKDLYITSFFYFILLLMAIAGAKEWKKHLAHASPA